MKLLQTLWLRRAIVFLFAFILILPTGFPLQVQRAYGQESEVSSEIPSETEESFKRLADLIYKNEVPTQGHELDPFRLLNQKVTAPFASSPVLKRDLILEVDGLNVPYRYFDGTVLSGSPQEFLLRRQDTPIHRFSMPTDAVSFFDHYLVFLEKNSFNAKTGVQHLSFIDLDYFESALGKTTLPIFRLPVQTNEAVTDFVVEDDAINLGNTKLTARVFEVFSEVQQIAFNMTVNMVDPASVEETIPLVDDFATYYEKALELRGNQLQDELSSMVGSKQALYEELAKTQAGLKTASKFPTSQFNKEIGELITQVKEMPVGKHPSLAEFWKEVVEQYSKTKNIDSLWDESTFPDPWFSVYLKELFFKHIVQQPERALRSEEFVEKSLDDFLKTPQTLELMLGQLQKSKVEAKLSESVMDIYSKNLEYSGVQENLVAQRKLFARTRLLWSRLSFPRPLGAPSIEKALHYLGTFSRLRGQEQGSSALKEALSHVMFSRGFAMGVPVTVAGSLLAMYPNEIAGFLYQGLHITESVLSTALGTVKDLGALGKESVIETFKGFDPVAFKEAYLTDEMFPKFMVGLTFIVTTLYVTLGIPHLYVNLVKLVKDMRSPDFSSMRQAKGWVETFIQRQNKEQKEYLGNLSEAEAERSKTDRNFTAQDNQEVEKLILNLDEKYSDSWFSRVGSRVKESSLFKRFFQKSGREIETFRGALTHFLFSFASFTNSGYAYTRFWNTWFAFRSFIWSPLLWVTFVAYPNYYSTAISKQHGLVMPTVLNGGMRNLYDEAKLRMGSSKKQLEELRAFEEKIIPVEAEIYRVSMKKSFEALLRFTQNKKELYSLMKENGIQSVTDETFLQLTWSGKTFFRSYFRQLYDKSMETFLRETLKAHTGDIDLLKQQAIPRIDSLRISPEEALRIVTEAAGDVGIFNKAKEVAVSRFNPEALTLNTSFRVLEKMDPEKNMQVSRIQSVNHQLKNPKAMARAVRAMIASNLVDKPMELAFIFICMAGVGMDSPLLAPIQKELFSETSWFYLSRYIFAGGFIYGVLSGVLADTWLKLQQFELHDGSYDRELTPGDKNKSWLSYYTKQAFRNPENSLWKNQKHYIKIIWANMKAAFVTTAAVNVLTLGRLDLDSYLIGYLVSYFTPYNGLAFKLENAFELSMAYFTKDIPHRLRAHPAILQWLSRKNGSMRIKFNLVYKLYENILGNLVGNFEQLSLQGVGKRALSRILFFGYTPTELAYLGFRKIEKAVDWIPGATGAVSVCERFLTNNYEAFEKISVPKK